MQDADLLLTIAEIAVAFAGFAGLATVVATRVGRDSPAVQAVRFRGMILITLLVVGFCLLPLALHRLGLSEAATWRISSAGVAAGGVYIAALLLFLFAAGFIFVEMFFAFVTIDYDTAGE